MKRAGFIAGCATVSVAPIPQPTQTLSSLQKAARAPFTREGHLHVVWKDGSWDEPGTYEIIQIDCPLRDCDSPYCPIRVLEEARRG
jgi:hypothetical protein